MRFLRSLLSKRTPSEASRWKVGQLEHEGYPLFVRYPSQLNYDVLQAGLPVRAVISVTFDRVSDNGLPTREEQAESEPFDQFVVEWFRLNSEGVCVLVETFGGKRHYYFYAASENCAKALLASVAKAFPDRPFQSEIAIDRAWSFIRRYARDFLQMG